jgi:hypothetical protein
MARASPCFKRRRSRARPSWAQVRSGRSRRKRCSSTVAPKPRSPEVLAELLIEPAAARARRQQPGGKDESPRAPQVRRLASLVRPKPAVRDGIKADAERRDPQHRKPVVVLLDGALGLWHLATTLCKEWRRVTCVLDIMPVVGDL